MRVAAYVQPCDPSRLRKSSEQPARDCRVFRTHWHLSHGPLLGPEPTPGIPTFSAFAAAGQKIH